MYRRCEDWKAFKMENDRGTGSFQELFPLMIEVIPDKFLLQAKEELKETEEKIEEGLAILRECIQREQLKLSGDANFLSPFLRQAKFDFKRAQETLIRFTKFLAHFREFLASRDLKRVQAVVDHKFATLLPFRDKEGRAVICVRAYAWPKESFDMHDVAVAVISLFMFSSTFPMTSVCGINYLADATVNKLSDYIPMFGMFKTFLPYLSTVPYRIKRVDIVNTNIICRCFVEFLRTIVPLKIMKRMFLHGGKFNVLQDAYPKSMLPRDFEGTLEQLECDDFKDKFFDFLRILKSECDNTEK